MKSANDAAVKDLHLELPYKKMENQDIFVEKVSFLISGIGPIWLFLRVITYYIAINN